MFFLRILLLSVLCFILHDSTAALSDGKSSTFERVALGHPVNGEMDQIDFGEILVNHPRPGSRNQQIDGKNGTESNDGLATTGHKKRKSKIRIIAITTNDNNNNSAGNGHQSKQDLLTEITQLAAHPGMVLQNDLGERLEGGADDDDGDNEPSDPEVSPDKQLQKYLHKALENLMIAMKDDEQMKAKIDPMNIPIKELTIDDIKVELEHVSIHGLSNFRVLKVEPIVNEMKLELSLEFPDSKITGHYNANGKVACFIPICGEGKFHIIGNDVKAEGHSSLSMTDSDKVEVKHFHLDLDVKTIKAHFEKLYGGGYMGRAGNRLLNMFGMQLFDKAKPRILDALKEFLVKYFNENLKSLYIKAVVVALFNN